MKLVFKTPDAIVNNRMNIIKKDVACLESSWHYHAQCELIYITKSTGIRFVGDSVSHFSPGDLVLVGPYLPHLWRNDASYYEEKQKNNVLTLVIKFNQNFLGEETFKIPVFQDIKRLLSDSRYGVSFGKETSSSLHDDLMNLEYVSPIEQRINFLNILYRLSLAKDQTLLSSSDMRQLKTENEQKIDVVLKFISDNYTNYITLEDVAQVATMTTNSFCRFFKRMTNKSFTEFLNEVRIRHASRLLVQNNLSIAEVGYTVGFNTPTNFNKRFKQIMGCTPSRFLEAI
ncbi:AraC family transcriptional regulator [Seonamhaeicola maritimus]|uniref:AraC family transcriptional regulator n=1 Tax=Seonamhaeicola maritimus TaxID=2591822 RepID=A0A5C7GDQ1_9FLAO|nr:AraC family transcriptional regulator [Seonamhaeicola maritimus]TXG34679.1 AraC family transcriptional regulator [Seonamhaeicola maritimus]